MPETTTTTTTHHSSCDACYNGCVSVTPDACVRYTGINQPALGITTGESLLDIENTLITRVISFLDGTGIDITINPSYYCTLVSQYLVDIPVPNIPQLFSALVRAACSLQSQVSSINGTLAILNADYSIGCLTGVTASDDTHAILQAVITKLCSVNSNLTSFEAYADLTYVKLADLNALIAAYLSSQSPSTQQYVKMVPYAAVEYYGPLSNFDGTGAGKSSLGWSQVYLCNGSNGTPDKRGRVGVGAILDVPGGPLSSAVNPIYAGNPNYDLGDLAGANTVGLNVSQIPSHTHATTVSQSTATKANGLLVDPGHTHYAGHSGDTGGGGTIGLSTNSPQNVLTTSSYTNISVTTAVGVSNGNTGGGENHANIQPVIAAYYIMYIPS
jgi:microcystin-dependent protein